MKATEAVKSFQHYQADHLKNVTIRGYAHMLNDFSYEFRRKNIQNITTEEVYHFLKSLTQGHTPGTKRLRWTQTKAFFTYCIRELKVDMSNPCEDDKIKKAFKIQPTPKKPLSRKRIEKMLSMAHRERDRLLLDLLSTVGLEAGELLALKPSNVRGRTIQLSPKVFAYLPSQLALRLKKYIRDESKKPRERIFKLSYSGLRVIVLRYAEKVNLKITPNDLRKYAGLSAHRKGVPLEFISRVMFRHRSLETTMTYLGLPRFPKTRKEIYEWIDRLEE